MFVCVAYIAPVRHRGLHVPVCHRGVHVPIHHYGVHVPVRHCVVDVPARHCVVDVPVLHLVVHVPARHLVVHVSARHLVVHVHRRVVHADQCYNITPVLPFKMITLLFDDCKFATYYTTNRFSGNVRAKVRKVRGCFNRATTGSSFAIGDRLRVLIIQFLNALS